MSLDQQPNSLAPVIDIFSGAIVANAAEVEAPFVLTEAEEALATEIAAKSRDMDGCSAPPEADLSIAAMLILAARRTQAQTDLC